MTDVLIGGIGNVLLGDDGVGPFVIKVLESQFDFPDTVTLVDLGTPGLELPVHLSGADAVILVDSATFGGFPGDIRLFRKHDILRTPARARIDPHSPALRESMSLLALMGAMPRELVMIGVQGSRFEPGSSISAPVRRGIPHIVSAVKQELRRLNIRCEPKASISPPQVWWEAPALRS